MIRRPPRATQSRSSAASDVYKRQRHGRPEPAEPGRVEDGRGRPLGARRTAPVSYTHLRAHETRHDLVCRLLLEKKKKKKQKNKKRNINDSKKKKIQYYTTNT